MTFRLRRQYMQRSMFLAILLSSLMVFSGLLELTENNELQVLSEDEAKLSSNRSNLLAKVGTNGNDELITLAGANQFNYFIGSDLGAQITFTPQISVAPSSQNDFYVASMDTTGAWQWAATPDLTNGAAILTDMAVGVTGEVYITGLFVGTMLFSPNVVINAQNPAGDAFVAKTDPIGNWVWAYATNTVINGTSSSAVGLAIELDIQGNAYATGGFTGETDFGGQSVNVSDRDVFVVKLNGNTGNLDWVATGGGVGTDNPTDIAINAGGDVFVSGISDSSVSFGQNFHASIGNQDSFITSFDSAGNVLSLTGYGVSNGIVNLDEIIVTGTNDLFGVGNFTGGTFSHSSWSITSTANRFDGFVMGELQSGSDWAVKAFSSDHDILPSMSIMTSGDLIISGYSQTSMTFGSYSTINSGSFDSYLAGLSSSGSFTWAKGIGSNNVEAFLDIATDGNDTFLAVGTFTSSLTIDSQTITSSGGLDGLIYTFDGTQFLDSDSDGVPDVDDNCVSTPNPNQANADGDSEGDECDSDDDNDGLTDNTPDNCPRGAVINWTSTQDMENPADSTDYDYDGCNDALEDQDDDNDGILDVDDQCDYTPYSPPRPTWVSNSTNDIDGDGCRDLDEDLNDDGDAYPDAEDTCPSVAGNSSLGNIQGCPDDDLDGWANTIDDCPQSPGNSTANNTNACPDADGDTWADSQDAFPADASQWFDTDGDGFGDNLEGTNGDVCPNVAGTSMNDRIGCLDTDGDGYSDADATWQIDSGADAFPDDSTQWSDFDEDGYGDNWGNDTWDDRNPQWPGQYVEGATSQDACPTQPGSSTEMMIYGCIDRDDDGWSDSMDDFPSDETQYLDSDGDGYGDNPDGNQADACPNGTPQDNSTIDRLGCQDSDGDGYSWDFERSEGADEYPLDTTKWSNVDGDNYADQNEDDCIDVAGTSVVDRLGCLDSDGDGLSDPDSLWTVENGADACPSVAGTSTADRLGCLDSDGDGYSDEGDAFPLDATKYEVEVIEDETSSGSGSTIAIVGIAVVIVGIIGGVLLMRGRGKDEEMKNFVTTAGAVPMPDFSAQPVMPDMNAQPAQAVAMPDMMAQPTVSMPDMTAAPAQAAPVNDPAATDYYNGLIGQGYTAEQALQYTQQYFPGFNL